MLYVPKVKQNSENTDTILLSKNCRVVYDIEAERYSTMLICKW